MLFRSSLMVSMAYPSLFLYLYTTKPDIPDDDPGSHDSVAEAVAWSTVTSLRTGGRRGGLGEESALVVCIQLNVKAI